MTRIDNPVKHLYQNKNKYLILELFYLKIILVDFVSMSEIGVDFELHTNAPSWKLEFNDYYTFSPIFFYFVAEERSW